MSGTDVAYDATSGCLVSSGSNCPIYVLATRCPVLTQLSGTGIAHGSSAKSNARGQHIRALCASKLISHVCFRFEGETPTVLLAPYRVSGPGVAYGLHARYAMSCTELAYGTYYQERVGP
eukprot:2703428-Rhodomonas_salina.1